MNSLLFLSSDDFVLKQTNEGNILTNVISGFLFGKINVYTNKQIIHMSNYSITPIKYVPLLILYFNGYPLSIYNGQVDILHLKDYIVSESNKIHFDNFKSITREKGIPQYTIGVPLCGEHEVTYLEFDEAYMS